MARFEAGSLAPNCLAGGTGLPTLLSPARQRQSFPTARSQLPSAPAPAFLHIPALNLAESSGWRTFPGLLRFGEHAVGVHSRRRYRHGHGREAARLPDECAVRGRAGGPRWEEASEIRTSRGGRLAAGGIFRGKFRRSDESNRAGLGCRSPPPRGRYGWRRPARWGPVQERCPGVEDGLCGADVKRGEHALQSGE